METSREREAQEQPQAMITDRGCLDQVSHEGKLFISALQQIEENGNVEIMATLFDEGAELWRQSFTEPHRGLSGARRFWKEYLDQFEAIHSRFQRASEGPGFLVLEWESQGHVKGGRPIHYAGVSIVELGANKKVKSFRTYFDSAHFLLPQSQAQLLS